MDTASIAGTPAGHRIVDAARWTEERVQLLEREKALTRLHDEVAAARRALPWRRIDKDYVFDTAQGRRTLAGLFGDARQGPAARSLTRAGTGPRHETRSYSHELLAADLAEKRLTPVRARVKARTLVDYGPLDRHEGQQFLLVLSGTVTMHLAGEAPFRLAAGDSLYFDARTPHACLSDGPEEAEILWIHAG